MVQAAPQAGGRPGPLRSTDLLGAQQAVEIEHNGLVYRLQSTRSGKLILTK
nr:hemin uptake protein HemP [Rhodoferax saidenbachensis]